MSFQEIVLILEARMAVFNAEDPYGALWLQDFTRRVPRPVLRAALGRLDLTRYTPRVVQRIQERIAVLDRQIAEDAGLPPPPPPAAAPNGTQQQQLLPDGHAP